MPESSISDVHFTFKVQVVARSSRTEVVGEHDGGIKVKLAAPPVDGKANEELIRLLSKIFKVSRSEITIVSGRSNKLKVVRVAGITEYEGKRLLKLN